MLRNDQIQAGIVEELKSISAITALVAASEIREDQWSGTEFTYPNIRVQIVNYVPSNSRCDFGEVVFIVQAFSEEASSRECDLVAGTVATSLKHAFTANGIFFVGLYLTSLGSAYKIEERTWQANAQFKMIANG